MKAWMLDSQQGVESMRFDENVPDPVPEEGEVLLKVLIAGLNPADSYLAQKQYPARPTFPHILGRECIGEIVAHGSGVSAPAIGSKVGILRGEVGVNRRGTFAELVAVPANLLVPVPSGWKAEEAAGAPLVYLTAYQAITQWGENPSGVMLVTGASGGVGLAAVHLGKAMGLTVIALSRGSAKQARLLQQGADFVADGGFPSWKDHVRTFLKDRSVDLVVDNIGGELFSQLLDVLGFGGKVSVVGRLAGPVPRFNTASLFFRRLRIGGVAVGTYSAGEARAAWDSVLQLLEKSGARPIVDSVHPFADLKGAFARLALGPFGKVLVRVAP